MSETSTKSLTINANRRPEAMHATNIRQSSHAHATIAAPQAMHPIQKREQEEEMFRNRALTDAELTALAKMAAKPYDSGMC
jgi:hypothetical protein